MQVPLAHIPPLVSHMSCVFIGLLLSFYMASDKTGDECFLPGKLIVSFPKSYFSKEDAPPLAPGRKVYFTKVNAAKSPCLIKNSSALIIQNDPFVVAAFHLKSTDLLPELLNTKNKGQLTLIPEASSDSFHNCTDTQIQYGYSR